MEGGKALGHSGSHRIRQFFPGARVRNGGRDGTEAQEDSKDDAPPALVTPDVDTMFPEQGSKSIMKLFDPNPYETYDVRPSSIECWCFFFVRFAAVVMVSGSWRGCALRGCHGRPRCGSIC